MRLGVRETHTQTRGKERKGKEMGGKEGKWVERNKWRDKCV
jgi:hypothetical protein